MKELQKHVEYVYNEIKAVCDGTDEDYPSVLDYLNEVLDIEYTCTSTLDYLGAKFYVTLGGPCIWIDTRRNVVKGIWGPHEYELYLPEYIVESLDFNLNEIFNYHKEG